MTERLIGETGSKKRRRFLFVPIVLVACMALFVVAGAQAVHDEKFQLDGNVLASSSAAGRRRRPSTGTACSTRTATQLDRCRLASTTRTSSATSRRAAPLRHERHDNVRDREQGHAADLGLAVQLRQQRQQQDRRDELLRDDLYRCHGDEILYFGIERNVNTGTANVGFWFLQDEVGCSSTGGAVSFTGAHQDGDLLVVSEFSGGGTVSTINAYRWDRPSLASPGSLNPVPIAAGVDCRNASLPAGDATCGAANTGSITTPWLTAQKTTVGNTLGTALFFEAGLNLTDSGLGGKCFSTFLGDTRSSTSLTATLFDFSGGTLGSCESGVVTTPSAGSDGSRPDRRQRDGQCDRLGPSDGQRRPPRTAER